MNKFLKPCFAGHYSDMDTEPRYYSRREVVSWLTELHDLLSRYEEGVIDDWSAGEACLAKKILKNIDDLELLM